MKVISTNISDIQVIKFRGKNVKTGIFKYPTTEAIFLGKEDVAKDNVIDRRYHGGFDKACYLYSTAHYNYWKVLYPNLKFDFGMFGENLSIDALFENKIYIGDIYQLGEAKVQISQPREPCFKLGARFETQKVVHQFLKADFPGIYLRVLEEGNVSIGDEMTLLESPEKLLTVLEYYRTLVDKIPNEDFKQRTLKSKFVREKKKEEIIKMTNRHL